MKDKWFWIPAIIGCYLGLIFAFVTGFLVCKIVMNNKIIEISKRASEYIEKEQDENVRLRGELDELLNKGSEKE